MDVESLIKYHNDITYTLNLTVYSTPVYSTGEVVFFVKYTEYNFINTID